MTETNAILYPNKRFGSIPGWWPVLVWFSAMLHGLAYKCWVRLGAYVLHAKIFMLRGTFPFRSFHALDQS